MKGTADRRPAASVARSFRCIRRGASPLRPASVVLLLLGLGLVYSPPGWSHECPSSSNFLSCHVVGGAQNAALHSISAPGEAVGFTLAARPFSDNYFLAWQTQFTCASGGVELFGWRHVTQARHTEPTDLGGGRRGFTLEVTSAIAPGIARGTTYDCESRWGSRYDDPNAFHSETEHRFSVYVPSAARLIFNGSETDPRQLNPSLDVLEGGSSSFTVRLAGRPNADVTVSLQQSGTANADVTLDKSSLTFTSANWSTAQTVTVRRRRGRRCAQ